MPDPDYIDRIVRARCGDEIADQIITWEIAEHIFDALDAMAEKIAALEAAVDARPQARRERQPSRRAA
jgi:hypothetical protein